MRTLRTSAIAVAAASLVAGVAVLLPTTGAEAVDPPLKHNWLVLQTGATNQVSYYKDVSLTGSLPTTANNTQALTADPKCALGTNGPLVTFEGMVGTTKTKTASLAGGSIGVPEKTSGVSCSRVDAGETLTLTLNRESGPFKSPTSGLPLALSSALLEVDLKQNARILATARGIDGTTKTFELQSGSSLDPAKNPYNAGAEVFQCTAKAADSGSDSGASDNCYWPIDAPDQWFATDPDVATDTLDSDGWYFDQLTLESQVGSFALQGGAETGTPGGADTGAKFLPPSSSFFEVSYAGEGVLPCNSSTQTEPASADGTKPEVTVRRLGNANTAEPCQLIPYTLSNGTQFARFLKPLDAQRTAQFVLDMKWTVSVDGPPVLPVTAIDFETDDPREAIPLKWCPDPEYSGDGKTLIGIRDPLNNSAATDMDDGTGKQFACVGTQDNKVVDGTGANPDKLVVTEQIYLLGDAWVRR